MKTSPIMANLKAVPKRIHQSQLKLFSDTLRGFAIFFTWDILVAFGYCVFCVAFSAFFFPGCASGTVHCPWIVILGLWTMPNVWTITFLLFLFIFNFQQSKRYPNEPLRGTKYFLFFPNSIWIPKNWVLWNIPKYVKKIQNLHPIICYFIHIPTCNNTQQILFLFLGLYLLRNKSWATFLKKKKKKKKLWAT